MEDNKLDAKLREWLIQRFRALGDISSILLVSAPEYRDPEVYLKKLIVEEVDLKIAEKRVNILEKVIAESKGVKENKDAIRLQKLRIERTEILANTDWTQLPDVPLSQSEKKDMREYRAFLRELPQMIERKQYIQWNVPTFSEWDKNRKK